MCQITYTNLHRKDFNSLMGYCLTCIGSDKNDDGTGFMIDNDSFWKTELQARRISNYGEIISDNIEDDRGIPWHIRAATYGIPVTKENAHPFIGDYYILIHNGTLISDDESVHKDKRIDSDSLFFLNTLDRIKKENPKAPFVTIFNKAMDGFSGKFAFIIRERSTGDDYIIRGKTAELWVSYVTKGKKKIGYVINTSDLTLKEGIISFKNIAPIINGVEGKGLIFSSPELLTKETIFLAKEKEVVKIGETKEKEVVKIVQPVADTNRLRGNRGNFDRSNEFVESHKVLRYAEKIYGFLSDHSFSLMDFTMFMQFIGGISILEMEEGDADFFIDRIVPVLAASKDLRKKVKEVLKGLEFPHDLYIKYDIEYPWTLENSKTKILKAIKEFMSK